MFFSGFSLVSLNSQKCYQCLKEGIDIERSLCTERSARGERQMWHTFRAFTFGPDCTTSLEMCLGLTLEMCKKVLIDTQSIW